MQDRDYWGEWHKERDQAKARKRTKTKAVPLDLDNANPPKLWGADWHWTLKLLVWLLIAVLMLAAWRLTR